MNKILFVCHGNICRSPMAEFILKDMVKKLRIEKEFLINSCATSTEEIWNGVGNLVYPPAKRELEKHNISCDGKRAVQLRKSDYDKYDLLIAMDDANIRSMLKILGGDPENKIYKLMQFANKNEDVDDPWYTGKFDVTYNDIYIGCKALLNNITKQNSDSV